MIEPATGNALGEIANADAAQIASSAQQAAEAQRGWYQLPYDERAALFREAAHLAESNFDSIVGWLVRESGSTQAKAAFETSITLKALHESAALPSRSQGEVRRAPGRRRPGGRGPGSGRAAGSAGGRWFPARWRSRARCHRS